MKNLIRITVFAFVIVVSVFAVRCTTAKQEETATDSAEVVAPADTTATDSVSVQ
jgi:outer membrane lipoprotein-sorting protein